MDICCSMVLPRLQHGHLLWHLEHLLPSFSDLDVHTTASRSLFYAPLLPSVCYHSGSAISAAGLSRAWLWVRWSWLELAVSGPRLPLQPLAASALSCTPLLFFLSFLLFFHFPFLSPFPFYSSIFSSSSPFLILLFLALLLFSLIPLALPSLRPVISYSDKRIIILLKQKYKIIINLFYETRTEITKFHFILFIYIQNKESVSYLIPSHSQKFRKISKAFFLCFFFPALN